MNTSTTQVSIVVPLYNEIDNIDPLYKELSMVMADMDYCYEIIFVDDGSVDGTPEAVRRISDHDSHVRLVRFRRNFGQTAAMHAGIQHSSGKYVVTMDGDMQNDPNDIPMMLQHLEDGYDLVHGWRRDRKDHLVRRKIPSRIANWLISRVTRFPIHDLGCTLKAMRCEVAKELELYGEMHRFIPILADRIGAKAIEVVTNHRERQHGVTKYGIDRTIRVVLDLITVRYMQKYFASPMKLFGLAGFATGAVGCVAVLATVVMKLLSGVDMTGNPMLLLAILSVILSVQFFSLGLLGEVAARIYFAQHDRKNYYVGELVGFESEEVEPEESLPKLWAA